MQIFISFNKTAFKHGISETDIRYAAGNAVYDDIIDGYADKHLLLGFDNNGNLLEILYNIVDEYRINVFHAMKCRKAWQILADR